jgi:hypothetical protein
MLAAVIKIRTKTPQNPTQLAQRQNKPSKTTKNQHRPTDTQQHPRQKKRPNQNRRLLLSSNYKIQKKDKN